MKLIPVYSDYVLIVCKGNTYVVAWGWGRNYPFLAVRHECIFIHCAADT